MPTQNLQFINPMDSAKLYRYPAGDITQLFGEHPELYSAIPGLRIKAHNGWDIVKPYGTPIRAVCASYVADIKDSPSGYGRHIRLISNEIDNYYYEVTFGHLAEIRCRIGDFVRAGDVIGTCGNSGFVVSGGVSYWYGYNPDNRGTHLHLTVRQLKIPIAGEAVLKYPNDNQFYGVVNYENGFAGAIDPGPFFMKILLETKLSILQRLVALWKQLLGLIK